MKRLFSIICLLLVVSFLFAGCLQKKEEDGAGAGETATQEKTHEEERLIELKRAYCAYAYPSLTEEQQKKKFDRAEMFDFYCYGTIEMEGYEVVGLNVGGDAIAIEPQTFILYGKQWISSSGLLLYCNDGAETQYSGKLYVYQNGTLTSLPEACEKGIVTEEDLKVIDEKSNFITLAPSTVA